MMLQIIGTSLEKLKDTTADSHPATIALYLDNRQKVLEKLESTTADSHPNTVPLYLENSQKVPTPFAQRLVSRYIDHSK